MYDEKMTLTDPGGEPSGILHEPGASADDPMAKVRPGQAVGTQLARARILGALFRHDHAIRTFGRFHVLERLGAGGMGVVHEAYDPDLAREVALKLVNVAANDREAALAEARALARLSHPNIVPIYDVGLENEHVYLVMELVRGVTLRQWSEGKEPLQILEMYRQAGVALAAAHAVGLVHRDFKPENAIVGIDGRVRVVDFGLACKADDPARATSVPLHAAGTPRFMAPEIAAGGAIAPAADQYSFCVALRDALDVARKPAPRRIAAVLERGRAVVPTDRFESMDHLLRALVRDPARRWRRTGAVGGLAASIGVLAFLLGRWSPSNTGDLDTCNGGAAWLAAALHPAPRMEAPDQIVIPDPEGPPLRDDLDAHANRWAIPDPASCSELESFRLEIPPSPRTGPRAAAGGGVLDVWLLRRARQTIVAAPDQIARAQAVSQCSTCAQEPDADCPHARRKHLGQLGRAEVMPVVKLEQELLFQRQLAQRGSDPCKLLLLAELLAR